MDVQEILPQLATNTGTFPREAVAQAIAQREAITPELLRVLVEAQHKAKDKHKRKLAKAARRRNRR